MKDESDGVDSSFILHPSSFLPTEHLMTNALRPTGGLLVVAVLLVGCNKTPTPVAGSGTKPAPVMNVDGSTRPGTPAVKPEDAAAAAKARAEAFLSALTSNDLPTASGMVAVPFKKQISGTPFFEED